jgi:hypothetical protein
MPTLTSQLVITALFAFIATGNVLAQSTTERVFHFAHTPIEQKTLIGGFKDWSEMPSGAGLTRY